MAIVLLQVCKIFTNWKKYTALQELALCSTYSILNSSFRVVEQQTAHRYALMIVEQETPEKACLTALTLCTMA